MEVRYFRRVDEGLHPEWGGDPTYWLEVDEEGDARREIVEYPDGHVLSYDPSHPRDRYGALSVMVVDGDASAWASFSISREDFLRRWRRSKDSGAGLG